MENRPESTSHSTTYVLILISALFLGMLVLQQYFFSSPAIREGMPAPSFTLPSLSGGSLSLEELRGKLVFLNFWVTWCSPCRKEMPSMERLYKRFREQGLEILAVSVDQEGRETVIPFQESYQLSFPILLDSEGKVNRLYRTTGFPETFLIDPLGKVIMKIVGPRDWDDPESLALIQSHLPSGPPVLSEDTKGN